MFHSANEQSDIFKSYFIVQMHGISDISKFPTCAYKSHIQLQNLRHSQRMK